MRGGRAALDHHRVVGGSYGRAINEGANIPFTEATGIRVEVEDYNGGLAQIRAQVDIGEIHWDVVDLEIADAVRGCDEGLLEPIDITSLPPGPDGTPAEEDFVAESQTECGVGNLYWSTVYAYNADNIPGDKPTTMADFFDLERFPGRRGMRRVPQVNLEFALIADGVALDQVYATLDTPDGLDRAFAKLATIKDEVIWWEAGAQPPQMLADGEVVMTTAYNGRIFNAQVREPAVCDRLGMGSCSTWAKSGSWRERPGSTRRCSTWPSPRARSPWGGSAAASRTRRCAGLACRWSRPMSSRGWRWNRTCRPAPANVARALRYDWAWWVDNQDELNERFSAWLAR